MSRGPRYAGVRARSPLPSTPRSIIQKIRCFMLCPWSSCCAHVVGPFRLHDTRARRRETLSVFTMPENSSQPSTFVQDKKKSFRKSVEKTFSRYRKKRLKIEQATELRRRLRLCSCDLRCDCEFAIGRRLLFRPPRLCVFVSLSTGWKERRKKKFLVTFRDFGAARLCTSLCIRLLVFGPRRRTDGVIAMLKTLERSWGRNVSVGGWQSGIDFRREIFS
jgi:hypothetical protein